MRWRGIGGAAELRGGGDPDAALVLSAAPDVAVDGVAGCSGSECPGVADDVAEGVEVEAPGIVSPAENLGESRVTEGDRALIGESVPRACALDAAPDYAECARSERSGADPEGDPPRESVWDGVPLLLSPENENEPPEWLEAAFRLKFSPAAMFCCPAPCTT
jgi:hypothetical protein